MPRARGEQQILPLGGRRAEDLLPCVSHHSGLGPFVLPTPTRSGFCAPLHPPGISFQHLCVCGGGCRREKAKPLSLSVALSPPSHHLPLPWSLIFWLFPWSHPSLDQPTAKSGTWSWRLQPVTTRGQQSQRPGRSLVPRCWAPVGGGWPVGPIFVRLCTLPAIHPELDAAPLYYRVTPGVGQDTLVPVFSLSVTLGKLPLPRSPGAPFPQVYWEVVG